MRAAVNIIKLNGHTGSRLIELSALGLSCLFLDNLLLGGLLCVIGLLNHIYRRYPFNYLPIRPRHAAARIG